MFADWTTRPAHRPLQRGLVQRGLVQRGLVQRGPVQRGLVQRGLVSGHRVAIHLVTCLALSGIFSGDFVCAQNSSLLRSPGGGQNTPVGDFHAARPLVLRPVVQGGPQSREMAPGTGSPGGQPLGTDRRRLTDPATGTPINGASGSRRDLDNQPLNLEQASFLYQPPPQPRKFAINDIVTIRVDEITRMMAEGEAENRKITQFQAVLSDWLRLDNGRLRPDPQNFGDPTVAGNTNSIYRAEATVETRESLTFSIASKIVDIRPNGLLVLEATKSIRVNDNLWEKSLTGICRAQDIAPDNVVLSRDLLEMTVNNQDRGQLRDGYKRGWFTRWFDRLQPF